MAIGDVVGTVSVSLDLTVGNRTVPCSCVKAAKAVGSLAFLPTIAFTHVLPSRRRGCLSSVLLMSK